MYECYMAYVPYGHYMSYVLYERYRHPVSDVIF